MSGKVVPKLRIVRCPKCRKLLQEPPGFDVYKCGGCGTELQAKKQSAAVNSESSIQEIDADPRNALDLVSEGKQCGPPLEDSLKEKATTTSGEYYLDGNVGKGQNENGEYNGGQLVPFKFSDEELESELDIYKLSLRRHRVSNKGGSTKITHCEIEEIDNGNLSLERPKEELTCASDEDGNDDKSALIGVRSEMEITESSNLQGEEELNKRNLALERVNEELISCSDEEDAKKEKSVAAGANHELEIIGSGLEGVEDLNNGNLSPDDAEEELISGLDGKDANNDESALVGQNFEGEITGNNDQSAIEDAKSEVDTTESTSTTKRPGTEKGSFLHATPGKLEEVTSGNPVSPSNQQQKQAQKKIHRSSDRVRSVDTLDTTELRDHSSELSGVLRKLSKPPTTRSSYAYDSSLSSHDRMDERFPTQHLDSLKSDDTVAEGRTKKGKGLANSSLYGDLGTQHQSHLPNGKHHVMKESRRNQNKVLEATRYSNPRSRMPFQRRGSQSRYENGRPSNGIHDELYTHEDTDQEKMKLLRMIYKLQDQLNKTRYTSRETNGRLGVSYKGNHIPAYHSHDLLESRFSHDLEHPRCNGRCSHGVMWHQRHKYSRIPYSAEATSSSCAHHVDHSCFRCCPHVSADSPPRDLFQHEDLYRSYSGKDYSSSHRSYSSSPQWFTASKLPLYGSETKSDGQRHRAKRHQRPVAGGAPFITCHKCLKLLQLPVDFLLYKKACHQLKCGECSEVLKFSLKNGSHIVSFSSNAIGLPSSEVIRSGNLPSASQANYYQYSPAKPISYYDDYGLSVSQCYSSEGDPVSLTQFHPLRGSEYVNPSVSPSTTVKEKIASRFSSTTKAPMETNESADLSSNMSGSRKLSIEMEARPQSKASLHKLMGYSTPSQVIRGTSVEGKGAHTQFRQERVS